MNSEVWTCSLRLVRKMQDEFLRTYLFTYSTAYDSAWWHFLMYRWQLDRPAHGAAPPSERWPWTKTLWPPWTSCHRGCRSPQRASAQWTLSVQLAERLDIIFGWSGVLMATRDTTSETRRRPWQKWGPRMLGRWGGPQVQTDYCSLHPCPHGPDLSICKHKTVYTLSPSHNH